MSLYHETAAVLSAPTTHGGSLKSRVFGNKDLKSPPAQVYALALESTKWSGVLKEVIEAAQLLQHERKLTPLLALLLTHDLLLTRSGIALPVSHGLRASLDRHRARLSSELTRARLRRQCPTLDALRQQVDLAARPAVPHPRWVRVNTLRSTVDAQLTGTFAGYDVVATVGEVLAAPPTAKILCLDGNVPNLLALPPGADLTKSEAYRSGELILQDKASCFPAVLLDPRPGAGDVVDGCAAPGNKTTHAAAILDARGRGEEKIFAFEKDKRRAEILAKMVCRAGCDGWTVVGAGRDFLKTNPADYQTVGALLLDPSCSGSGIVGRDDMPELHLPEAVGANPPKEKEGKKRKREKDDGKPLPVVINDDGETTVLTSEKDLRTRIEALAAFQLAAILHAMAFPNATRITYSTCSVYAGENEHVVLKALASDVARGRGWRILRRQDQVTGMREWPVRGDADACDGDTQVAEGCIRTYRDDGRGVMGFFVAGFVRDTQQQPEEDDGGPFVRDAEGRIVRDENGIPTLKATGKKAVDLDAWEDEDEESEEYYVGPEDDGDGPYVRDAEGRMVRDAMGMPTLKAGVRKTGGRVRDGDGDGDGDDEWDGFDD